MSLSQFSKTLALSTALVGLSTPVWAQDAPVEIEPSEAIEETGDQGQEIDSPEELKAVYDYAKGNVESPEYDFLREDR